MDRSQVTYVFALPRAVLFGKLSDVQVFAVRLACARHELMSGSASAAGASAAGLQPRVRAGFYLGDGPGVGKGRQVAAVLYENFLRGRTRAVWFSGTPLAHLLCLSCTKLADYKSAPS